ncbi:MAG: M16 family metallopeptidase [Flavobacteriaceae bacterium]
MKSTKSIWALILTAVVITSCQNGESTNYATTEKTDSNGLSYETVENDPTGLRLYTLENGLKVYLSQNHDEPKIQTYIAVKAGSNYDPSNSTGLAHYLEHMVFKGTHQFGTLDWEKEQPYLEEISDLYERHRATEDPAQKLELYKEIDRVSYEASNYAIANEYDKMIASLGAQGTNAYTWFEQTVYTNKIPANELDKWLHVESARFKEVVLRLFHTELEAVFEEFNRGQDNDFRKSYAAMLDELFPTHPYGQQTTIGTAKDLKNPSMVAIHNYFDKYYVPSNMAVVLVGDFEFEETISKINNTFGQYETKSVEHPELPVEDPITEVKVKEVFGPTSESVSVAYRTDRMGSEEAKYVTLIDMILANSNAGLMDLNLNQKGLVQNASSSPTFLKEYGFHRLYGSPKQDQSLEEVRDLMLDQIDLIKKGEFEDWMIEAVVNDLKLSKMRRFESNTALADAYVDSFIYEQNWAEELAFLDDLKKISKQDLMDFANAFYKDNYVVVYKRKGEDDAIVKVANPGITPVNLNRGEQSFFMKEFNELQAPNLEPQYVDYAEALQNVELANGIPMTYVENPNNDIFNLNIIFDMGKNNKKILDIAVGYLAYVGTSKYSAEELRKEFYKLGIDYGVSTGSERTYVYISGLKENLEPGLELLEELWSTAVADQESFDKYIDKILKGRSDMKSQKGMILQRGLVSYAMYGEDSELRNIYQSNELKDIDPEDLVEVVRNLKDYKQRIFYYGKDVDQAVAAIDKLHKVNSPLKDYPEAKDYAVRDMGDQVYFTDYDMVQAELMLIAKEDEFDPEKMAAARVFNTYFGSGLSSIVFQEIREEKALAYSAYAVYSTASKSDRNDLMYAYVGTQANKLNEAVDAMMQLMNDMPLNEQQFEAAKSSVLKKIAAERITKSQIFWSYESLKRRGIDYDNREEMYQTIQKMTMDDLSAFFQDNVAGSEYSTVVIGNKNDMDVESLKRLGKVEELDVDYLFNFKESKVKQ